MRKRSIRSIGLSVACALLALLLSVGCAPAYETVRGYGMGSYLTVTAPRGVSTSDMAAEVAALENIISHRVPSSLVSALNGGEAVALDGELAEMLRLAERLGQRTDGRFSVFSLPVTRLWNFDSADFAPPSEEAISAALSSMASCGLAEEDGYLSLTGGGLDLGAVGKGYAADRLAALLRERTDSGLISVGGSIVAVGQKGDAPWQIGIRDPFGRSSDTIGSLSLTDMAVSTSGNYEKTREYDGKQYHHILNATTGWPAESGLVSVTVVAESCALTDMLATACFIVGAEECFALCREYGARAVVVTDEGEILASAELADILTVTNGGRVSYR